MLETVIAAGIVVAAVCVMGYKLYKGSRNGGGCASCAGCEIKELREKCGTPATAPYSSDIDLA